MCRECEYIAQKMLNIELPGKRKTQRPEKRFMDVVKEDLQRLGVTGK